MYEHLIGKRINVHGEICTVTGLRYSNSICVIETSTWPGCMILSRIVDAMPEVISRASFDYVYQLMQP